MWAIPIKHKCDAASKIMEWKATAVNQCGHKVLNIRTDGGGKYFSNEFKRKMALSGVTL